MRGGQEAGNGLHPAPPGLRESAGRLGFSLVELLVVMLITSVVLGLAVGSYNVYQEQSSARRAAELFARDISLARATAMRERQPVAVLFEESQRIYWIRTQAGRGVVVRNFSAGGEFALSEIALDLPGDSLAISPRGMLSLEGLTGPLGIARFRAGSREYFVSFNALGATRIDTF